MGSSPPASGRRAGPFASRSRRGSLAAARLRAVGRQWNGVGDDGALMEHGLPSGRSTPVEGGSSGDSALPVEGVAELGRLGGDLDELGMPDAVAAR